MTVGKTPLTSSQVQGWLVTYLAQLLSIEEQEVDLAFSFAHYGLDSSAAVGMSSDLGDLLGTEFDMSLAYDYPTINAIVEYLVSSRLVSPAGE